MGERANPWNGIYSDRGHVFRQVHEDIGWISRLLSNLPAARVLDLGSGTGRHLLHFARLGFSVYGLDDSPEAIRLAREWLADAGLSADLRLGSMHDPLPYRDGFFDGVVSIQVIHHARIAEIQRLVGEMSRVLKPGGLVFVTVPTLRNQASTFHEVEPGTLVPLDGPERGLPHHYFNAAELREAFAAFDVDDVHVDEWAHLCLSGSKRQT